MEGVEGRPDLAACPSIPTSSSRASVAAAAHMNAWPRTVVER